MELENARVRRKRCIACRELKAPDRFIPTKAVCKECDFDGYQIPCTNCGVKDSAANFPARRNVCWTCLSAKKEARNKRLREEYQREQKLQKLRRQVGSDRNWHDLAQSRLTFHALLYFTIERTLR